MGGDAMRGITLRREDETTGRPSIQAIGLHQPRDPLRAHLNGLLSQGAHDPRRDDDVCRGVEVG